jgi:hypothetical protein
MLVITRRSAVKARTRASNQIKAFLLDAADDLRARLRPRRKARFARACAALDPGDGLNRALASLGRRWLALDQVRGPRRGRPFQLAGLRIRSPASDRD